MRRDHRQRLPRDGAYNSNKATWHFGHRQEIFVKARTLTPDDAAGTVPAQTFNIKRAGGLGHRGVTTHAEYNERGADLVT